MILSIVDFLPDIKYLTMKNFSFLPRDDLVKLLRGCKDLVFLDVRNGRGFKESDEEILALSLLILALSCVMVLLMRLMNGFLPLYPAILSYIRIIMRVIIYGRELESCTYFSD